MDKVVHFEIPVDNAERAKKFYKESFEWQMQDLPEMKYITVTTAETDENRMVKEPGAINGGMFLKSDMPDVPLGVSFAVDVQNIDDAIKKIKNAGGLIIKEKMPVGDMGFMAYFKDTEGNILSVWQTIPKK